MSHETTLNGKVALVTGASSGIGKATALTLAKEGMQLALISRRLDSLLSMRKQIEDLGSKALPLAVDLRDESQVHVAFDALKRELGGVDVLVNSAGLGKIAPLVSGETESFREMLEVNVLALAVSTREAVKSMTERNVSGHIVHVSSMSAYRVQHGTGMYAATKHAVRALAEGLRQELREMNSPIRVTSISPGDVDTEFLVRMYGKRVGRGKKPPYSQLSAQEIADTIIWALKSPANVDINDVLMRPVNQPD